MTTSKVPYVFTLVDDYYTWEEDEPDIVFNPAELQGFEYAEARVGDFIILVQETIRQGIYEIYDVRVSKDTGVPIGNAERVFG